MPAYPRSLPALVPCCCGSLQTILRSFRSDIPFVFDIFVEIFRGFNHIEENSLRGAGDVVFPMGVSILSCWLMSVFFSYLLGVKWDSDYSDAGSLLAWMRRSVV